MTVLLLVFSQGAAIQRPLAVAIICRGYPNRTNSARQKVLAPLPLVISQSISVHRSASLKLTAYESEKWLRRNLENRRSNSIAGLCCSADSLYWRQLTRGPSLLIDAKSFLRLIAEIDKPMRFPLYALKLVLRPAGLGCPCVNRSIQHAGTSANLWEGGFQFRSEHLVA